MTRTDAGLEQPGRGEDAAIAAIAGMLVASVRREAAHRASARRDAHPKHHAIVRGEFRVSGDVPAELRHGLFATPRTYPVWIRFSNGSPRIQPDGRRDQRGMAIKLLEVPGPKVLEAERDATTQDFVLASFPRFFIRSVADYVAFTQAATRKPALRMLSFFFKGAPWRWKLHELGALAGSLRRADDLLALRYWSQTPYRLGPHAVKYSALPQTAPSAGAQARAARSPDFLREVLAARLLEESAEFSFAVQRQTDPIAMPTEDPTIVWDEALAPFERVATIVIPPQRFDSPAQMALAEQIAFTPWHSLPDHAPIGGMNRVRRVVYEAVSRERHRVNGTVRREPGSLTLDEPAPLAPAPPAPSFPKDAT